jgi:hypothetical protein
MTAPRLSIIPAGAVTDETLEPRDLQVLCLLGRHTDKMGWCLRSQVKMAREIRCGRATLQRSLERLYDAGWVEKRRRDLRPGEPDTTQPSASYAYRVRLDRDDYAFEGISESHAEDASPEDGSDDEGCPPAGTPNLTPRGAQPDGHPGAHTERARGAHTYAGTITTPSNVPPLNVRETRARANEDLAKFIAALEIRWPRAVVDDRQKIAYEAAAVPPEEREAAIAGIAPFLEELKAAGRTRVPALWKYLLDRKWQRLAVKADGPPVSQQFPRGGSEARAIGLLFMVAQSDDFFLRVYCKDGFVGWNKPFTEQLGAMAKASGRERWRSLPAEGAASWNEFIRSAIGPQFARLRPGSSAPWPWPPSVEGKIYEWPPEPELVAEQPEPDHEPDAPELAPEEAWQEPDETFADDSDSDGEAA